MSVMTEADRRLEAIRAALKDVVANLSAIVVGQCDGYDEFSEAVKSVLKRAFQDALDLRDRL